MIDLAYGQQTDMEEIVLVLPILPGKFEIHDPWIRQTVDR